MNELAQQLKPETARRIFWWQMAFFGVMLTLSGLDNTYSVMADRARLGHPLPLIAPMVWEFSSQPDVVVAAARVELGSGSFPPSWAAIGGAGFRRTLSPRCLFHWCTR